MSRLSFDGADRLAWTHFALAVLFFGLWLAIFFLVGKTPRLDNRVDVQSVYDIYLPSRIDNAIGELNLDVTPVDLEEVAQSLGGAAKEFKDKSYFEKNRKRWTVQVMDVGEQQIVLDYLDSRSDRDKFAYFRYTDTNNKPRYVLTYDLMGPQQATGVAKSMDFSLPTSNRVIPEQIERYLSMIDNYTLIVDEKPADVQLKPTKKEIAPKPIPEEEPIASFAADEPKEASVEPAPKPQQTPDLPVPPTARPNVAPPATDQQPNAEEWSNAQ